MAESLTGIRVLEFGQVITAPLAGMMLADLGADVIKVEPPSGDPFRTFGTSRYSSHFAAFNKNKRSVVLDLKDGEGMRAAWRLLDRADVVIENFRPGVMDRLGIGWTRLHAMFPRLVVASITGFGTYGPYRDRPAYDTVASALAGITYLAVDPDDPELDGPTISDNVTGMYACYGILAALMERERTGIGRHVEVNMFESAISFIPAEFTAAAMEGAGKDRLWRRSGSQSYAFCCADGRSLVIHLSTRAKFWDRLVTALYAPELAVDDRFATGDSRVKNYLLLGKTLGGYFKRRPRDEWLERLIASDVPCAPVHSALETLADPHLEARASFGQVQHPQEGPVTTVRCPVTFDGTRRTEDLPPPTLGQHTEEICDLAFAWGTQPSAAGRSS